MGCPDSGPRQHGHAAVLLLRRIQVLLLGEHVGEGVKGLAAAQSVQTQRIPVTRRLQGGLGRRRGRRLRGERRGAGRQRGEEGEGKLGHGDNVDLPIGWQKVGRVDPSARSAFNLDLDSLD